MTQPSASSIHGVWRQSQIVLVEDDCDDAYFVRRALREACIGNPVVEFDSAAATEQYTVGPAANVALFIIDIRLHGPNTGLDFLRWLRSQTSPIQSTPAMILSSSDEFAHLAASEELGALRFLRKPVTSEDLVDAIEALGFTVLTNVSTGEVGFRIIEHHR